MLLLVRANRTLLRKEGRGFIRDPNNQYEAVGVSMFHQLHCLVSKTKYGLMINETLTLTYRTYSGMVSTQRRSDHRQSCHRMSTSTQSIALTTYDRISCARQIAL